MKCIIFDDDILSIKTLKNHLEKIDYLDLAESFNNLENAKKYLDSNFIDLLFIDYETHNMNSIKFVESLNQKPLTIIISKNDLHALDAFELGVVDFITKPIHFSRLYRAIERAKNQFETKQVSIKKNNILPIYFFIRSERKIVKIKYENVLFIKGLKDYIIIYLLNGHILTAVNLKTFMAQINHKSFIRINKSCVINTEYINYINNDLIKIQDLDFILSVGYRENFQENYLNNKIIKRLVLAQT